MKKLIALTVLIFSFGLSAETKMSCFMTEMCIPGCRPVNEVVINELIYHDGLFEKKLIYDGKDWSDAVLFKDDRIKFGADLVFTEESIKKSLDLERHKRASWVYDQVSKELFKTSIEPLSDTPIWRWTFQCVQESN